MMHAIRSITLSLFFLPLAIMVVPASATAQSSGSEADWQTLQPEREEFTVVMPKGGTTEASPLKYHQMDLSTRLYLYATPAGPVYAVVSIGGIKSNKRMYSEMERLNSYVDAFKRWFPQKVRAKETVAKLTLVGDKQLNGHAGREYRMSFGDLSGVADVFVTRKRFYAVVFLNTKKDDQNEERFLSSFVLPEKTVEPPPAVAAQQSENQTGAATPPETKPPKKEAADDDAVPKQNASDASGTDTTTANAPADAQKQKVPVSGGMLNSKAISLPKPDYPAEARAAGAVGTVVVQVTVDEQGTVIAARAVSGHQLLQAAAVNAAFQARFQPTFLMGEPVRVSGVLSYNFARE